MPKTQVVLLSCLLDKRWDERVFSQRETGTGEMTRLSFSAVFLPIPPRTSRLAWMLYTHEGGGSGPTPLLLQADPFHFWCETMKSPSVRCKF